MGLHTLNFTSQWLYDSSDFGLLGVQSSPKMGDSLSRTPMNRRAKFDAASFILAGEICNRTNTQKQTDKQTVNDNNND